MGRLVLAVAASAAIIAPTVAFADQPRAVVEGEMDHALRALLVSEIGQSERPVDNRFEARRRARDAAETSVSVLRSEGYYEYDVRPEVGEGDAPTPRVVITPGPQFTLAAPKIDWSGKPPAAGVEAAAAKAMRLQVGRPGRAADVVSAEGRIVSALDQAGYADAKAEPRRVIVDHATRTVQPTFHIAAGGQVRLDGLQVSGDGRTNPRWVEKLAPWRSGQTYSPELVAELERRLLDPGVFDSVTVSLAPPAKATPDGLRPVMVSLAERKPRTIEAGASYASEEGFGLDLRWTRYNSLRRADTLTLYGRLSGIDSRAGGSLALPHWRRPAQTLTLGAEAYNENTKAYDQTGVGARADIQRRYGRTSYVSLGVSADYSQTDEVTVRTLTPLGRNIGTFALHGSFYLDRSDDALDPKRGWRLSGTGDPTFLTGDGTMPYLRLQTQVSAYLPLDRSARTVLAGRARVGTILHDGTVDDIPAPQRFYAGGGGSVRGFAYQAVGPRLEDGTPEGGISLFEGSIEVRHRVRGPWGVVAFVDAGDVGLERYPEFKNLSVGAGLGVRYNLPFGPIRFDIATPVAKRRGGSPIQVYVSIGQSF
ncbi:autotransporter assembly complex protein TamA [Phenylobacterium sp. LjRoot219]|uniref:autotransporter assembly complex protein TamA n=1 Tax=Phenylobacterium sp. LjRoot219 TaxID=3342283 RepID=UPI003ED03227